MFALILLVDSSMTSLQSKRIVLAESIISRGCLNIEKVFQMFFQLEKTVDFNDEMNAWLNLSFFEIQT